MSGTEGGGGGGGVGGMRVRRGKRAESGVVMMQNGVAEEERESGHV